MALVVAAAAAGAAEVLPGTRALEWAEEDLSARMMDGAHAFVERKIAEARGERAARRQEEMASVETWSRVAEEKRARLKTLLGAVDARVPAAMERYGDGDEPGRWAETPAYRVWQVRWAVLEGVRAEGLLVEPRGRVVAGAVLVPDAGQSPEELLENPNVRALAERGIELAIPVTVSRAKLATEDAQLRRSDQTYREWIYRQAFHLGRHPLGYEVQTVQAAVDAWRARRGADFRIGAAGYGEGGLAALAAAALDTRIAVVVASGALGADEPRWTQPIYRNVWRSEREFGDEEIAALVAPRTLLVEVCPGPEATGHKGELRPGPGAAAERSWSGPGGKGRTFRAAAPWAEATLAELARELGAAEPAAGAGTLPEKRFAIAAEERHRRYVRELEGHVQTLVRRADEVREKAFLHAVLPELAETRWSTARRHPVQPPEKFVAGARVYRERFHAEAMGRFEEPKRPARARTRRVAETAAWTAYDVVLDVFPELFAWGLLVVPKDLQPGERRPAVVCQHGRNGLPRDLVLDDTTAYGKAAAELAERGFVTFAPHNLYRGEDRYRWLTRKANAVGATLFSFIIPQHEQIVDWLAEQPFVDGARIGFYGLSYGGETAMRVPPVVERYAATICSGDFNQWTRKVAATDLPWSFMRTIEWEMPYWNLGHTFDYAEMAYLLVPRPLMVERGHHDRVGRDPWVAHEYAKVRWLYAQLGLADRTEIEYFQGGHSMNREGAYRFLHRHLAWPERTGGTASPR